VIPERMQNDTAPTALLAKMPESARQTMNPSGLEGTLRSTSWAKASRFGKPDPGAGILARTSGRIYLPRMVSGWVWRIRSISFHAGRMKAPA
jgi:hypothetical protein